MGHMDESSGHDVMLLLKAGADKRGSKLLLQDPLNIEYLTLFFFFFFDESMSRLRGASASFPLYNWSERPGDAEKREAD
jgi:hypothetical protein